MSLPFKNHLPLNTGRQSKGAKSDNKLFHETLRFDVWVEKKKGQGEDARPILEFDGISGLLAVFDGLGGTGSTEYKRPNGTQTGAYIASRCARNALAKIYNRFDDVDLSRLETGNMHSFAANLKEELKTAFRAEIQDLGQKPTKIITHMLEQLPTTMAAIWLCGLQNEGDGRGTVFVTWAGDSRAYLLTPKSGLQQITKDDLATPQDALQNLRSDAAISNTINADNDFKLNYSAWNKNRDACIFLTASDGCFGYLPTPMEFEYLLLDSMAEARDERGWQAMLTQELDKIAADDVSMALLALGWSSFADMKAEFGERRSRLTQEFVQPLREARQKIDEAKQKLANLEKSYVSQVNAQWGEYRHGYEGYLRSSKGEAV